MEKLKVFISSRFPLQEILKKVLQEEGKPSQLKIWITTKEYKAIQLVTIKKTYKHLLKFS